MRVLTTFDLERQITSDGATWLDRTMLKADRAALVNSGFGREVQEAWEVRKEELVRQGHAWRTPEGGIKGRRDLLAALERQEVERVGKTLAAESGVPFAKLQEGELVQGKFTGTVQLASGKYAMIDSPVEMQLVPWRPVIDPYLGREVSGIMHDGGGIEWTIGRSRGLGI